MIKTNNTPCTYEELYYEMWETAGRYSKITRFQVIGSSHDERMIPAVWVGNGNQTVFCIAGMIGTDRHMPGYLVEMMKEYTRAWECGWKLEEIYDLRDLFEKWTICFVPILNPDGYEIYENDFFAIRNPIYRQMLRMQEVSCKEFTGNARGTELRKNFPTGYYRRKQIHQQPASENETKALVRLFQDDPAMALQYNILTPFLWICRQTNCVFSPVSGIHCEPEIIPHGTTSAKMQCFRYGQKEFPSRRCGTCRTTGIRFPGTILH